MCGTQRKSAISTQRAKVAKLVDGIGSLMCETQRKSAISTQRATGAKLVDGDWGSDVWNAEEICDFNAKGNGRKVG